jgi:hypothetical protein
MLGGWRTGSGRRWPRTAAGAVLTTATATALAATALAGSAGWADAAPRTDPATLPAGVISTVAGGVGGPGRATSVTFGSSTGCGTLHFAQGRLYIADQDGAVRTVSMRTGELRTPVGVDVPGFSGDGGPAGRAELDDTCAATLDAAGNLVIADTGNGDLRVVAARSGRFYGRKMTAGDIYSVLSGKPCTYDSNSGTFCPVDVVVDHSGNLLVSNEGPQGPRDPSAPEIEVVAARSGTFYGQKMSAGGILLLASDHGGAQIQLDRAGNLLMADNGANQVEVLAEKAGRFYGRKMKVGKFYNLAGTGVAGFSGDRGPAVKAMLNGPTGVTVDRSGNVVISDTGNSKLRVVAVRTARFYGQAMTAGDIYTVAGRRAGLTRNGVPAIKARLISPGALTVDSAGNLVECDGSLLARVIAARSGRFYGERMKAGDIYTVAGSHQLSVSGAGGPATRAQLFRPAGVVLDHSGNLLLTAAGQLWAVPARSGTFYGKKMTAGDIYAVAGGGTGGLGDGGPATRAKLVAGGIAVDAAGNVVLSDNGDNLIRIVATRTGSFYGQAMKAEDIYTVAGGGTGGLGDGGPATQAELAEFEGPAGVAVDSSGNLVVVDTDHFRLRVVAVRTGTFYGQPMTAGDIYTVAGDGGVNGLGDGGPAVDAQLQPGGVAVDGHGNLVIGAEGDQRVRVVAVSTGTFYGQPMTAGDIYTVAGTGTRGFSGDGRSATKAELDFPVGVQVDGAGNLVVADDGNSRIRVVAAKTGTFHGAKMTAGDIYTVAGNGIRAFSGDGGPAAHAELSSPAWVAIGQAGDLLISDNGNNRIRMITS